MSDYRNPISGRCGICFCTPHTDDCYIKRQNDLIAELKAQVKRAGALPDKWRKECLEGDCVTDSYSGCVGLICPDKMANELDKALEKDDDL